MSCSTPLQIQIMNYLKAILLFFFIIASNVSFSQRYGTAFGLRLGNSDLNRTIGISLQQRIQDRFTVEGILQTDFSRNTTISILAENHHPIISKRFNYYLGAGIAVGNEESFVKNGASKEIIHTYGNQTFGLDLIGGLEMTMANAVISLDYKPNFNIAGREEFFRGQVGISARTVLVKSKEQKRKQRLRQKNKRSQSSTNPFSKIFNTKN